MQKIEKIDFAPKDGNIESLYRRLADYISIVDEEWSSSIKPALKEDVDELVRLSMIRQKGYSLPESYMVFLNYMGENDGGLLSTHLLVDASITELLDFYDEVNRIEPETINPELLTFGVFESGIELSLDFRNPGEPTVVVSADGEVNRTHSQSLEKLLFQNAFYKCEKIRFPVFKSYGGSERMLLDALEKNKVDDVFEIVKTYASDNNFFKAWISDSNNYIAYRNDAAFIVNKQRGMLFNVYGEDRNFIIDFGERLSKDIGAD